MWQLQGITPAYFTLGVVALVFVVLTLSKLAPDVVMVSAVAVLLLAGVLGPRDALAGMSNEGMITVAVLFVVGAGVRETGGVEFIASKLFGRPKSETTAVARMMLPTMGLSAFMNNTPLVAMLIPAVTDWARKLRMPVSKFMIPLSYAAILGGTCTLIGTSTNLVVQGMLQQEMAALPNRDDELSRRYAADHAAEIAEFQGGMGMFDITWIGVPAALLGGAYIILASKKLLPDRRPPISSLTNAREYSIEMQVAADGPLVGKTIESAGLRHLPGVFLAEINRQGTVLPAVSPQETLAANDRLVFVGVVESVVDLQRMRGLLPATDDVFQLNSPRPQRCLIEAVVSASCPLVGRTIRDSRFRTQYNAVVVAVAREGQRIEQKIGDIVLAGGDTLLVEAHPSFVDQQKSSRDFLLVSRLDDSSPPRHDRAAVAVAILIGMVVLASMEWLSMLKASLLAGGLMLATRCVSLQSARRSVDWETLIAIAASFGLGKALETTGGARLITDGMVQLAGGSPWISLAVIYAVTLIVTELITNNAAAALMFPFAMTAAKNLDVNFVPFVISVAMAASAGFATPIGYQTNLMVYGPGGYRFSDYLKIGVPLDILIGVITVVIAPLVWPF